MFRFLAWLPVWVILAYSCAARTTSRRGSATSSRPRATSSSPRHLELAAASSGWCSPRALSASRGPGATARITTLTTGGSPTGGGVDLPGKWQRAGDQPLTGIFRRVTCFLPRKLSGEPTGNRRHSLPPASARRLFRHDVKTRSQVVTAGIANRDSLNVPHPRECVNDPLRVLESSAAHALLPTARAGEPHGRPSVPTAEVARSDGSTSRGRPFRRASRDVAARGRALDVSRPWSGVVPGPASSDGPYCRPSISPPSLLVPLRVQGRGAPTHQHSHRYGEKTRNVRSALRGKNMSVQQITGAAPAREATDSELAAAWAAEALAGGRIELGLAIARLASQAQRMERSERVRSVPVIGSTRDEAPREATPIHDGARHGHTHAAPIYAGPTGNGDEDLAREAATQLFGTPQPARLDTPETRRCTAAVLRDGVRDACHGVLYWQHGTTGDGNHPAVPAAWRHIHQDLEQDHPGEIG